ncbi:metal ABC transporter substrate-binding protein [Corynebacterium sp. YIM 101645]|uniref:Metal ABC transporter substrate-binding protein n=1 Tax=Corynebacterium lemuris TaxID=1859292 RepID=A0ABT2FZQ2_9CORY|nr:metal ABC transporter substrate-binding protein [Corynebacterium lemuris]MCS5480726.1 metal ABC transporter substrate-binding protein [Corynebacterium lemuris]
MRARFAATIALTAATTLILGACSADSASNAEGEGDVSLVVTTTPLGSVTSQLATCAGGTATTLMPVNADPHDFSASSAQVADMVKADLVIANGLGLEAGLGAALDQVKADGTEVLHVAELVNPLPFGDHAHEHGDGEHGDHEAHDHGDLDPHFWLDAARMAEAARIIGERVAEQAGDRAWADCGTELAEELDALDGELRETLAVIPEERRAIVTDHEAFGYFNQAYGFRSVGVVVPGGSTEAQPSSRDLAELAGAIREEGVPVIFSNVALNPGLVEALAAEVGESVQVVALYEGSVGPEDSPAADYQGMMRENARLVTEALS